MPELPEVETIKRDLEKKVSGLTIEEVEVYDARVLKEPTARSFKKKLKGLTIRSIDRIGKSLIINFNSEYRLFVQVKMTGYFVYGEEMRHRLNSTETKVVFKLSNGQYLNYNDQRLFGWLIVFKDEQEIPYINTIGPDPLNGIFTTDWLRQVLKARKAPIKTLLMNQHFVAGIGNIYASEILFASRISPKKSASRLTRKEVDLLHKNTVDILNEAIAYRGTSMRNYRDSSGEKGNFMNRIKVYGREDQPCFECNKPILRIVQSGRSTFYCKACQKVKNT